MPALCGLIITAFFLNPHKNQAKNNRRSRYGERFFPLLLIKQYIQVHYDILEAITKLMSLLAKTVCQNKSNSSLDSFTPARI